MALTKKATTEDRAAALADLDSRVIEFSTLKAQADELAEQIKAGQVDILRQLDDLGLKTHVTKTSDEKIQVTRVQTESEILDEGRFRRLIGVAAWNKITKRVLDKAKLDEAIKTGVVSPVDVADATNTKTGNPFIRLTRKK